MDRRKIYNETNKTIYDALNTDEINLEIANNLENMSDLKEIIKLKAMQTFEEKKAANRWFTIYKSHEGLEDNPRFVYVVGIAIWYIGKRNGFLSNLSLVYIILGVSIYCNMKRERYCTKQEEYSDFNRLNENLRRILKIKRNTMGYEAMINKRFGVEYNFEHINNSNEYKFLKPENLF